MESFAYATGLEIQLQQPRPQGDVILPPFHAVIMRFITPDLRMHTCLTSRTFPEGVYCGPSVQAALRDYPITGEPLVTRVTPSNIRVMPAGVRGGNSRAARREGNRLRESRLWAPPHDLHPDDIEETVTGAVSGWGVSMELVDGRYFLAPYLSMQVHEEVPKGTNPDGTPRYITRPLSIQARMVPLGHLDSLVEGGDWLFQVPEGVKERPLIPMMFDKLFGEFGVGDQVTAVMKADQYLFSRIETPAPEPLAPGEETTMSLAFKGAATGPAQKRTL